MRILTIHSDYIKIIPKKKAIKTAEELWAKEQYLEECLVVFTAVEANDENDPDKAAEMLAEESSKVADQVKSSKIILYPYAHLSSNLSKPSVAIKVLKSAEKILKEKFEVERAPFGWYKAFEISCKGHPLSELSREFSPGEKKEEKLKTREEIVEEIESEHLILTPDGKEYPVNLKNKDETIALLEKIGDPLLTQYVKTEEMGGSAHGEPPSIKAMQQMELIDYAPEADLGHFKFYPKGKLIFDLLADWAHEIAVNRLGSYEIETPILYDWSDPEIREQGGSFHERHYTVYGGDAKDKKMILRFAGDFGLFKIMKNTTMSYKHLPIRMYEFSKSFRYEQRGELTGLRRLRAFHMPDIHCFVADIEKGWDEYQLLYKHYDDLAKGTGVEYTVVFRIVKEFYDKNKDKIIEMLKHSGKPAFIEVLSKMKHYWAVKHEFQGIDSVGGNCQLSTVQLDVKDAKVYGIEYVDANGEKQGCIICHSSIGSLERWIYLVLEDAFKKQVRSFPLWLAPTQVRLVPVKPEKELLDKCAEIFEKMSDMKIRVDIDDSEESLGKRIRNAEKEWIPYILVIGKNELNSEKINVRMRESRKQVAMSVNELISEIKEKTKNMPFRRLPLPKMVSKRPRFYG
ncbi:MAG: threonine--tRNA ligase [Promethearchaeota archaeon]